MFEYRDPFGFWAFDWPELFRSVPSSRFMFGEGQVRVEEYMDGDTLVIRAELPGIDPDKDIEITIADGMLHIHAERRQEQEVEEKDLYRSEIDYGAFTRTLPLPAGAGGGIFFHIGIREKSRFIGESHRPDASGPFADLSWT